ncbi:hypothetical protein G6F68_008917 [Rhizopus microsporus]|nr:hypothetical protein G6F68_008917 [Rhizopus microsporus]
MTDTIINNEPRTYTEEEVIELLRRIKTAEQAETQKAREERELPLGITSSLDKPTRQQHQDNFKRYKREVTKYHHDEWTVAEEINKSFIPKLKQYTVDTTQVVNAHYKGAEISRLHGRAATEIYEQLSIIQAGEISTEEAHQLLAEAIESAKRLAVHAWIQGRQHDEDAKDYAIRALKLPTSLKHLETKEPGSKREAFSEEFITMYNEANYQQRVLRAATTNTSNGREEDVDTLDKVEQKTTLEDGDVGPRPSTPTTFPTILTMQHRQIFQHQDLPVNSNTKNITGNTCPTITTTTTINTTTINTTTPTTATTTTTTTTTTSNNNIELHHSIRRNSSRRSTSTISELLEDSNRSSVAHIGDPTWLQNPIYKETNPVEEPDETTNSRRAISHQRSSSEISKWRYDREVSNTGSTIPLQILYITGTDQEKANSGLSKVELFHSSGAFQNGRSSSFKRIDRKRRLYMQNRFKRCIRSSSYTRRFQRFPQFRKRRGCIQVQVTSVRAKRSSTSFLENNEVCHRTPKEGRNSDNILSGRHLYPFQDETRYESFDNKGETPFREIGFHNKLQEKHSSTVKNPGIFGVFVQQQDHDHFSSSIEDYKLDEENTTGADISKEVVQMDSKSIGENDRHDTSSRRSSITYQVFTEGFIEDITPDTPKLGNNMQLVKYQPARITLVGDLHNSEERVTNPEDSSSQSEYDNSRGCIQQWMGSQLKPDNSLRVLESGGETTIHKRARIEDDFICNSAPCKKMRRLNNKDLFRQQNSSKIHHKIRWNDIDSITRSSHTDPRSMQQIQHQGDISTYPRDFEHSGRQIEQTKKTVIRINNSKKDVQLHTTPMGTTEDRRICSSSQPSVTNVLDSIPRSISISNRCNETNMVTKGDVSVSTLEVNSASVKENSGTEIEASSSNHSMVAQPILVSNDSKNETHSTSNNLEDQSEMVSSRLAIINNYRLQDGITEDTIRYLNQKTRQSTHKAYDNGWTHWTSWCKQQQPPYKPLDYDEKILLKFLQANKGYSSTHLNTLRSSIASVFSVIHSNRPPIAEQSLIKDFFTAKRNSEVKIPTEQQSATWDISILVDYIKQHFNHVATKIRYW